MTPIVDCKVCGCQFRLEGYAPGAKVRCRCGHLLEVPHQAPKELPILHCSSCGGPISRGASSCDYCGGHVDRDGAKFTLVCPNCFARLPEASRFCVSCAHPIKPQTLSMGEEVQRRCPRCEVHLHTRKLDGITVEECPDCSGMWLSTDAFREVSTKKVEEFAENPLPRKAPEARKLDPVVYLKCPVCERLMNRKNYGRRSGVIIDECYEHGLWLDDDELERIARFIAEGGLQQARKFEAEEAKRQAQRARSMARDSARSSAAMHSYDGGSSFSSGGGVLGFLFGLFVD